MSVRSVVAELDFAERRRRGSRLPAARPSVVAPTRGSELESALLSGLLNQSEVGVAVCAPDGVLTMVNDALVDMLGHDPIREAPFTLVGCCSLQDPQGRSVRRAHDPLTQALRGHTLTGEVYTVVDRSGRATRALKCTTFPLRAPDGTLLGAALVAADVTEAVAEQRHLQDLRDELVDTVNHEVRTPLAVIVGHMELIEERAQPETLQWSLRAIGRATTQLGGVVDDISEIIDDSLRGVPDQA